MSIKRQSGFSLITAIFLLVVVAGLVVFMINIRAVQQQTLVYSIQGARAVSAARSGLEWGIYTAINGGDCNDVFSAPSGATSISSFNISVSCISTLHIEGNRAILANNITIFQITSTASVGTFGSLDYVSRSLQATVSEDPP
ncbi:MAG: MSHA biogenesis protein MshP [Gammaproteobacteria bacterium]|jgi:MSHA biogenesis protein MshP